MSFIQKHHRLLFYTSWIVLGLIQARYTALHDDEAYYWVFSKFPDWGYFDHPPLTAILIRAGYALIPNELGVRLFPFLFHILTILILELLTQKKSPRLFYSIALSFAVLQLSGFLAVPDTVLIFSTALFFLCYKKFISNHTLFSVFLLALSSALLMYSKYHGALVIIFTLLSNPALFKNYRIYLAGILALLLFVPHLSWQMQHDWVSVRYHLFESNVNKYKLEYTLAYLGGQILLAGPIAGIILIPAAFLKKPGDKLEKALRYTLIGIYSFFLLSSFRGKVEMNWTAAVIVPLFVLSFHHLTDGEAWKKWLMRLLPLSLLVVVAARLVMIVDLVPNSAIRKRYHAWKEWPAQMKIRTEEKPVVFSNSYQRASMFWFHTGQPSYSMNLYKEHRNQYNFWPLEDSLLGREVYYLDIYDLNRFPDSMKTRIGWVGYKNDPDFSSFAKIRIEPEFSQYAAVKNDTLEIKCRISMPKQYREHIESHRNLNVSVVLAVFSNNKWFTDLPTQITLRALHCDTLTARIGAALPAGKYRVMFAAGVKDYYPTHNSPKFTLTVSQ